MSVSDIPPASSHSYRFGTCFTTGLEPPPSNDDKQLEEFDDSDEGHPQAQAGHATQVRKKADSLQQTDYIFY